MNLSLSVQYVDASPGTLPQAEAPGSRPGDATEELAGSRRPDGPKGRAWGRRAKEAGAGPGEVADMVRRLKADAFERSSGEIPEATVEVSAPGEGSAPEEALESVVSDDPPVAEAETPTVAEGAPQPDAEVEAVEPTTEFKTEPVQPEIGVYAFVRGAGAATIQFDLVV